MSESRRGRKQLPMGETVGPYTIVNLIGQGGYGEIYAVRNADSEVMFAMKLEAFSAERRALDSELVFLEELQDSPLFPHVYEHGQTETCQYVIEELLGPSLSNTRRQLSDHHYNLSTVIRLSLFMLECIRDLHAHGFVHRDIKPGNFLLRCGSRNPLVLIDFGLSRRYIDPETREPYPERDRCAFRGTAKYSSINAHRYHDQAPRDDLVSWLYSMVELIDGFLPWSSERDPTIIQRRKQSTSDRSLFWSLPREFLDIWSYLKTLKYWSKPNYEYIICLLTRVLDETRAVEAKFDWEFLHPDVIAHYSPISVLPTAIDYVSTIPRVEPSDIEDDPGMNACVICNVA
jgi:serine/threonine protein kinase